MAKIVWILQEEIAYPKSSQCHRFWISVAHKFDIFFIVSRPNGSYNKETQSKRLGENGHKINFYTLPLPRNFCSFSLTAACRNLGLVKKGSQGVWPNTWAKELEGQGRPELPQYFTLKTLLIFIRAVLIAVYYVCPDPEIASYAYVIENHIQHIDQMGSLPLLKKFGLISAHKHVFRDYI